MIVCPVWKACSSQRTVLSHTAKIKKTLTALHKLIGPFYVWQPSKDGCQT